MGQLYAEEEKVLVLPVSPSVAEGQMLHGTVRTQRRRNKMVTGSLQVASVHSLH